MTSARDVVDGIMNPDPVYYAGRGNRLIDLNPDKLECIWEKIVYLAGASAGQEFVKMVKAMQQKGDVSATTFLSALSDLAYEKWIFQGSTPSTESATASAIEGSDHANWQDHDGILKDALKKIASTNQPQEDITPHKVEGEWQFTTVQRQNPSIVSAERIAGEFLKRHPLPPAAFSSAAGDIPYKGGLNDARIESALRRINHGKDPGPRRS